MILKHTEKRQAITQKGQMIVCHEPECNQMKKQSIKRHIKFQTYVTFKRSRSPVYAYSLVILCSFLGEKVSYQFPVVGTLIEIASQKACAFQWFYVNGHVHTSFGKQISI